ncbi:MAG: T9SS type A sorting domain-containing protein [Bacteroidia bacterium]|nr:T9SS type A sorting domain-containing protein [Bacteroidia bacterium]
MRKNYTVLKLCFLPALMIAFLAGNLSAQVIQTFTYTGAVQSFTVPSCVNQITITAKGAQGGTNAANTVTGALGGMATGVLTVTPGNILNIYVGGINGYNGGGAAGVCSGCSSAGGGIGGGASDVRLNGTALANRIIVGAGGGGAGGDRVPSCGRGAGGGGGAGYYGGGGGAGWPGSVSGSTVASGGSQASGGTGGTSSTASNNGGAGALGVGGAGGGETGSGQGTPQQPGYPSGPGGGLNGGSGFGTFVSSYWPGQGGAGGSSFIGTLLSASTSSANNSGNGNVVLAYDFAGGVVNAAASNTLICSGASINLTSSTSFGPVLSYTWNTGSNSTSLTVSPTANTVYTVSATNSLNCVSMATVGITVNSGLPVMSISSSTNQTCLGKSVSVTATGANTYTWSNNLSNGVFFTPTSTSTYVVTGQNACGTSTSAITITVAPLPVLLVASPTIVCSGQQTTLNVSSAATTFTWLPINTNGATTSLVVSPANNTTYTVAATDGTCSGVGYITVPTLANPTVSIVSSASLICEGDPVVMTASGGLSYTWTPVNSSAPTITVNPMVPTAYSVGATNSLGCSAGAQTVVITAPAPTLVASSSDNLICSGGTVTLTVSGATSYSWSTGSTASVTSETPLSSTVYTVTGLLNTCSTTQTVQVDVFTPSVSISGATVLCEGATTTLTANGADTYTWEPNQPFQSITITPLATTIYTVSSITATGNISCAGVNTIQVTVNPNPTVTAVASRTAMCKGESVTINAAGASTYSWSTSATTPSIVVTSSLITTLNYQVIGIAANSCTNSANVSVKVNPCVGITEFADGGKGLLVYPNPNSGEFTVESHNEVNLSIVNQLGQVVKTFALNSANNYKTKINGLSAGVYFIVGQNSTQNINHKIIVDK